MKKEKFNKFVQKYNLAGLIESVKWNVSNNSVTTSFISDDKTVVGIVSMKDFVADDSEFGVYDTSKLLKMFGVLGDEFKFSINDAGNNPVSLTFSDESTSMNYMLADLSLIPSVPDFKKLPDFDISVKLDSAFINKFIKSKSALSDENRFTFVCEGGKGQIILGHSDVNTNRIAISVECDCGGEDKAPISFSADFLKEILNANKDSKEAVVNITWYKSKTKKPICQKNTFTNAVIFLNSNTT
jgi:hypothetical protein